MQATNFGKNLQTFILSNDLSHQKVADLINEEMALLDAQTERIFMANDVWTIVGRGSTPRNHLVMVAIANIIGKSLEDLIVKLYTMSDLYRPDLARDSRNAAKKNVKTPQHTSESDESKLSIHSGHMCCESVSQVPFTKQTIATLFEKMSEADKDFTSDLMFDMEIKDNEVFFNLLLTVDMPLDDLIDIYMYTQDGSCETSNLLSDWASFAITLKECNYDPCAALASIVQEPLLYPFTDAFHVAVEPHSVTRYHDDGAADSDQMNNAYLVKMKVNMDKKSALLLYEQSIDHIQCRIERLQEEKNRIQQQNKSED